MTNELFEKSIRFRSVPIGPNLTEHYAEITFGASQIVDSQFERNENEIRKQLTEILKRHIYDSDRSEIALAIRELRLANPLDRAKQEEAIAEIFLAATRKAPK